MPDNFGSPLFWLKKNGLAISLLVFSYFFYPSDRGTCMLHSTNEKRVLWFEYSTLQWRASKMFHGSPYDFLGTDGATNTVTLANRGGAPLLQKSRLFNSCTVSCQGSHCFSVRHTLNKHARSSVHACQAGKGKVKSINSTNDCTS